jgi:FKBP-type peptidyl-prolyl cis-trans isomerase
MKQLTFKEWVAVAIALVIVGYFFFWNRALFSFSNNEVMPVATIATSTNTNNNTMTESQTYNLPGIQITDTVVGTGEEAVAGKTVVVNYTGKFTDGKVFDSSIPRGEPFAFQLGVGQVIAGWDEGVAGMKVGGKRILIISPEKGYGSTGAGGGAIPPNSTLVFEVELLDVQE